MSGIVGGEGSKSGIIGTTELDYEEGSYTYTLLFSSSGSITPRTGYTLLKYIKIGRVCNIFGKIETDAESSPSGQMRLSLPFTAGANDNSVGTSNASGMTTHFRNAGATFEDSFLAVGANAVYASFWRMDHDGTKQTVADGNIDATFELYFNMSYHTI